MMRTILTMLMVVAPLAMMAQNNEGWERRTTQQEQQKQQAEAKTAREKQEELRVNPDAPYLAGAVPEVDGKVCWRVSVDVPGASAQDLYDWMLAFFDAMATEEEQLEGSGVAMVNSQEHKIVASMREWMTFHSSLLALDRTKFFYRALVSCTDGHVDVDLMHLSFRYEDNRPDGGQLFKAEEWIADGVALNKRGDKLYRGSAKFRRGTVDRMNQLAANIRYALLAK